MWNKNFGFKSITILIFVVLPTYILSDVMLINVKYIIKYDLNDKIIL